MGDTKVGYRTGWGEGAALCGCNGPTRNGLLAEVFGHSLAGGFQQMDGEEGLQSVTLSPWRIQPAYSSCSTRSMMKLLRL